MVVYFVRHGEAKSEAQDKNRPLTEKGLMDTYALADRLSASGSIKISRIYHSGKLRARQTAEIFASAFAMPDKVSEMKGIMPMDDIAACIEAMESAKNNIMIVGHLPHLAKVASRLICGGKEVNDNIFNDHGVLSLEKKGNGAWAVADMFTRGDNSSVAPICL